MKLEAADRWLKGRLQMPTTLKSDGLARLAPAIRAHAFFSAGVAQGHVLAKLREVSDAFTRGEMDLATARKKLKDWLGKKEEPGSKEDRQMGRLWSTARLNLILRQNARMAQAVGEWEQGQSDISRKLFPYWRYVASVSESPRGSHRAYAGKVWRKEDPIWHRIFPPWDFNCKCSVEEVAADEVEPDDVEPTTTDDMMPDAAESGFAFDPAEALRVYDTSLIQDETLRGNVEKRLEEMGCARREDGKLEMPIKSSFDEWMANLSKTDEHSLDKEEKKAYKVIIETIQHLKSHLLEIPMRRAETIMNDIRERWIWLDNRLTEDWCEKHQLPEEEQSVINYSVKDKSIETIVERAVKCFQKIIPNDVAKFVNGITFMVAADNEE